MTDDKKPDEKREEAQKPPQSEQKPKPIIGNRPSTPRKLGWPFNAPF